MNILIVNPAEIHPEAIEKLKEKFTVEFIEGDLNNQENLEKLEKADALLVRYSNPLSQQILSRAKNLKHIISCTAGLDHIDLYECKAKGIGVFNAPGSNAPAVAEHTIALLFSVLRKTHRHDKAVREGKWERNDVAYELEGKTFGLVGFGAIGKLVAKKLSGFGLNFLVFDPYLKKEQVENIFPELKIKKLENIEEIIKNSDIISIHVPLTEETRGLIGEEEFSQMKKTAILLNTSRGFIVDEAALADALKSGKIYGAGLDVFEKEPFENKELAQLPNVVLTPHIAAMTEESFRKMCVNAVENFLREVKA